MKWRFAAFILPALLLLSAPLVASNMGVALRMQPTWYPQRLHFVSLPWLYTPATAEALCRDLGGSGHVSEILRWDETEGWWETYLCGSQFATPLRSSLTWVEVPMLSGWHSAWSLTEQEIPDPIRTVWRRPSFPVVNRHIFPVSAPQCSSPTDSREGTPRGGPRLTGRPAFPISFS